MLVVGYVYDRDMRALPDRLFTLPLQDAVEARVQAEMDNPPASPAIFSRSELAPWNAARYRRRQSGRGREIARQLQVCRRPGNADGSGTPMAWASTAAGEAKPANRPNSARHR